MSARYSQDVTTSYGSSMTLVYHARGKLSRECKKDMSFMVWEAQEKPRSVSNLLKIIERSTHDPTRQGYKMLLKPSIADFT